VVAREGDPREASFAVLRSRSEIGAAERRLVLRGLIAGEPAAGQRIVRRIGELTRWPSAAPNLRPDAIKSWDVELALDAIEASVDRSEAVLDMGSVGCAILPALRKLGYQRLHGVDLNPQVRNMASRDAIDYSIQDMTATNFDNAAFGAITSVSVIEHGLNADALLREVARLLRPGGLFLFSTDYWPQKVDTSGVRLFDLPWTIFSEQEIGALVRSAAQYGLAPAGELEPVLGAVDEQPINFADRDYTFLFGTLIRTA
jgi:SAM-dependent methyltransferase